MTPVLTTSLPTHLDLPDKDDAIVENWQEHPQGLLLTDAILPVVRRLFPNGKCGIGQGSGIYWRNIQPPLRGALAPDWFLVPGVDPLLVDGRRRRSYVLWQEHERPLIVLEFVSGDGSEERDRTPNEGKFWIYENRICPKYYGIYEVDPGQIEMHRMVQERFAPMPANAAGRFPIPELEVELGIWRGEFAMMDLPWMRWWDDKGNVLPTGHEQAEKMAAKLREMGVNPDAL